MAATWPRIERGEPSDPHSGWDTSGPWQTPRPTEETSE